MTQEFRTFTQRLTDEHNKTTSIFNVQAKTIVDRFGNDVVDSKGDKIWFPLTFDPAAAIAFGRSLASQPTGAATKAFGRAVMQEGPWDLQRSYNGQSNAPFASLFRNAASYNYGPSPGSSGAAPSPVTREPRKDRRSSAPDGLASTSERGATSKTPAFKQDALYSPAGNFFGDFPGVPRLELHHRRRHLATTDPVPAFGRLPTRVLLRGASGILSRIAPVSSFRIA
jgi:hypothetical protein